MKASGKREMIEKWMGVKGIDCLGIQDTKIEHNTKWRGDEYTWFFSTGVTEADRRYKASTTQATRRREGQEHRGTEVWGVAFVIRNQLLRAIEDVRPRGGRLLEVRMRGTIPIQILVAYATTATASDEEKDAFYELLQDAIDASGFVDTVILGDMNAKLLHRKDDEII
jgi:exonuclease III